MNIQKKVLTTIVLVIVAIQFMQPAHNTSGQALTGSFTKTFNVPEGIQHTLEVACYDCHSNNTKYPWYSNIQPFGWVMASHIKKGKKQLNFSEFDLLPKRRQASKLQSISKQLKDFEMPLQSYLLLHKEVLLSNGTRWYVAQWMSQVADSISQTIQTQQL